MDKQEFEETIAKINEKDNKDTVNSEENKIEEDGSASDIEGYDGNLEALPNLAEYLKSEEYVRNGKDCVMPLGVTFRGKPYKVFIRPITAQELYSIQLDSANKKLSIDTLVCELALLDENKQPLPKILIDDLDAGTQQAISAGIRILSGIETEGVDYKEIMEYFLMS